jgi:hypothetical protein
MNADYVAKNRSDKQEIEYNNYSKKFYLFNTPILDQGVT